MTGPKRSLSGTPWHTEFLKRDRNDPKRHRARCQHYNNELKSCRIGSQCVGAARCAFYQERAAAIPPPECVPKKTGTRHKQQKSKRFPVRPGMAVIHRDMGRGVVTDMDRKSGVVTIQFQDGEVEKRYVLRFLLENQLLVILK